MIIRNQKEFDILKVLKQKDEVKEVIPKQPKDKGARPQIQVKPICLLMAYMYDILSEEDKADPGIAQDIDTILRSIPSYIDIMLS